MSAPTSTAAQMSGNARTSATYTVFAPSKAAFDHLPRMSDEELRDAEIARRTMAKYEAQCTAIKAGDKPTMKDVQESVLDYVCAVPLDVVMRQRLAVKEQALAELVKQVMLDIAEIEAIKEVEGIEEKSGGLDLDLMRAAPAADARVHEALALIERTKFPQI